MNEKCPTCGRFNGKDVMEKVNMQATIKKLEKDVYDLSVQNKKLAETVAQKEDSVRENKTLAASNKLLEEEVIRLRAYRDELEEKIDELKVEIIRQKNRGFLSRLFNR